MNVASLELCKELYQLSGWDSCGFQWVEIPTWNHKFPKPLDQVVYDHECDDEHRKLLAPAYDLSYILLKLPSSIQLNKYEDNYAISGAYPPSARIQKTFYEKADTPEDVAAKVAIELFKQGVLVK